MKFKSHLIIPLFFFLLTFTFSFAQPYEYPVSEIIHKLDRLQVLGRALYLAAHPDDENTAVLSFLSNEKHIQTAYLSLTRGGGGQNLIGSEKGSLLGILRTQELLSARKIDGARQFFSRAIDFGYSKSAEETLNLWDREQILEDVVFVIRKFKPDVIITRFSKTQGGHGHHLASAILAEEALHAAADPERFKAQLELLEPWQVKRVVWDSWAPSDKAVRMEIGTYSKILGKSYQHIAAQSRSMHKSQGFGASIGHGKRQVAFEHMAGDTAQSDLFDGIDLSWSRFSGSKKLNSLALNLKKSFLPAKPEASVPELIKLYRMVKKSQTSYWKDQKLDEIKELIRMCSGLWLEAIVWENGIDKLQNIDIRTMSVNKSKLPMEILKLGFDIIRKDSTINKSMNPFEPVSIKKEIRIPVDADYFQPFWLTHPNNGRIYELPDKSMTGQPENKPSISAQFTIRITDETFTYDIPVQFRETDPAQGEVYRPFYIHPQISLSIANSIYVFPDNSPQKIKINLKNYGDSLDLKIVPKTEDNWNVSPQVYALTISEKGRINDIEFELKPLPGARNTKLKFEVQTSSMNYDKQLIHIDYPHITPQIALIPAEAELVMLDVKIEPREVGYIMGSGDDIPKALEQLGYPITLLDDQDIENSDLSRFDVIICGIRAFNTRDILQRQQHRITEFVQNGGTWIVQHNTRFGNRIEQIGPYPFSTSGRDRISEENAEIQILLPEHSLLTYPNKITDKDFEGWVQERGLYFADSWEGKLYPLLSGNDKGEPSKLGGLLYARYGKGIFIYTAFSWFRQLPAGVPGAYRLFVNLISAKAAE